MAQVTTVRLEPANFCAQPVGVYLDESIARVVAEPPVSAFHLTYNMQRAKYNMQHATRTHPHPQPTQTALKAKWSKLNLWQVYLQQRCEILVRYQARYCLCGAGYNRGKCTLRAVELVR